jgi:hypothetical protein
MVEKLVYFLSIHNVDVNSNDGEDHMKFFKHIRKISKVLVTMDKTKSLEPKFGDIIEPLARHIKDHCDSDQTSTITSNISVFKNNTGGSKGDLASLLAITGQ